MPIRVQPERTYLTDVGCRGGDGVIGAAAEGGDWECADGLILDLVVVVEVEVIAVFNVPDMPALTV